MTQQYKPDWHVVSLRSKPVIELLFFFFFYINISNINITINNIVSRQRSALLSIKINISLCFGVFSGDNATAATAPASTRSLPVNDTHCVICLENFSDSVLYQCGHMCVCYACGKHLLSLGSKCPMCRAPIKDIIRAYKCANE